MVRAYLLLVLLALTPGNDASSVAQQSDEDRPLRIVCFGDSTTATRGDLEIYSELLGSSLGTVQRPVQVINAGVGRSNTDDGRRRFQSDVMEHQPDWVVIQFGINDAAIDVWQVPPATVSRVSLEDYRANLEWFCQQLKATGCQVILMTPNPMCWTQRLRQIYGKPPYDTSSDAGFNIVLKQYAAVVRQIANQQQVTLLDVDRQFEEWDDHEALSTADFLLDGMHPNAYAHQWIAGQLAQLISTEGASGQLITSITKETLWRNRDGKGKTWFHPRACMIPGREGPEVLMTLQEIGGSDYFGPVHWTLSRDLGRHWSEPELIPAFGRDPVPGRSDDLKAAVCDVTPQYDPDSGSVLALGHVVFYKGEYFARNQQLPRYPLYAVRDAQGQWSQRHVLEWEDPRGGFIYSNNCGQRVMLPGGQVQMSFTFGPKSEHRMVAGVQADFDGRELKVRQVGPPMELKQGRGLLEPSVCQHGDQFWITMRAEDGHGYVSVSEDGLDWAPKQAWAWEDGSALEMSTTQQHWLNHSDGLFLVYTRKDVSNANVIRWRSPLYVAQVDLEKRCLIRSTERVVLPMVGDGVKDPDRVAMMGNFHIVNVSPEESWVTVGECLPRAGYGGDLLLARIRWSKPNRLPLW